MAERRFKPVEWARKEDVDELFNALNDLSEHFHAEIADLSRHQEVLELAILKVMQDVESMSDVLVDAGLLQVADDEEEVEPEESADEQWESMVHDAEDEEPMEEYVPDAGGPVDDVGPEVAETPAERAARIKAVQDRRRQAVQEQGVRAFEDGNESPEGKIQDPLVDVTDVPEEGVVIETRPND